MVASVPFVHGAIGKVDRNLEFTHVDHADVANAFAQVRCRCKQRFPP